MSKGVFIDITKFVKGAKVDIEKHRRAILLGVFTGTVKGTPIGNVKYWNLSDEKKAEVKASGYIGGRLRGNWQTNVGTPKTEIIDRLQRSGKNATYKEIEANLGVGGDTVYFRNNLPYAVPVEYEGKSQQAPDGMVRRNLARVKRISNKAVRDQSK